MIALLLVLLLAALQLPGRRPRRNDEGIQRLRVLFANIGRGKPAEVRRALERVRDRSTRKSIVGLVEITRDKKQLVRDLWGRDNFAYYGLGNTTVPLIVGRYWKVVAHRIFPILKKGIRRYSTPLDVNEVVVRRRWRPWAPKTVVICTHGPALFGGWDDVYDEYQRVMWELLEQRIEHHRRLGRNVIVVLDHNVEGGKPLPDFAHRIDVAWRAGLDAGLSAPARGFDAATQRHDEFALGIERQHKGHAASHLFTPITGGRP